MDGESLMDRPVLGAQAASLLPELRALRADFRRLIEAETSRDIADMTEQCLVRLEIMIERLESASANGGSANG
jgi:hypothetical protein